MKVKIIKESGYDEAILGLSLSYGIDMLRAAQVAEKLAHREGGHNKFLESIMVWIDITAPRYWWQEADTYRISSKQSESTMHTIAKRQLTDDDFEMCINPHQLNWINVLISYYNTSPSNDNLEQIKNALPEGFLQRRIWCLSYKALKNIIHQRDGHRLSGWKVFIDEALTNTQHKSFLKGLKND